MVKSSSCVCTLLMIFLIYNVYCDLFKKDEVFEENDYKNYDEFTSKKIMGFDQQFQKSLNHSEEQNRNMLVENLKELQNLFFTLCEIWQRPHFTRYKKCVQISPCHIPVSLQKVRKVLEKSEDSKQIVQAFGSLLQNNSYIHVALAYGVGNGGNIDKIKHGYVYDFEKMVQKIDGQDVKLKNLVKSAVENVVIFYESYWLCLNLDELKEFFYDYENYKLKADQDKLTRLADTTNEINTLGSHFQRSVMDTIILLSAEKARKSSKTVKIELLDILYKILQERMKFFPLLLKCQLIMILSFYVCPEIFLCQCLVIWTLIPNVAHLLSRRCNRPFSESSFEVWKILSSIWKSTSDRGQARNVNRRRRRRIRR